MPTANAKNNSSRHSGPRPAVQSEYTRGYQKIEYAARALKLDFRGKIVLDIGSSTGGFTSYALERGAKKVIAVEKGTNQMSAPVRFDPRIELHEKTDIFNFKLMKPEKPSSAALSLLPEATEEGFSGYPDLILIDVSFLSLTKILKYASMYLTGPSTQFLAMLKPQFEAQSHQLTKGIIKNEAIRRQIIKDFENWLKTNRFIILGKRDNATPGRHGNLERFYHLKLSNPA